MEKITNFNSVPSGTKPLCINSHFLSPRGHEPIVRGEDPNDNTGVVLYYNTNCAICLHWLGQECNISRLFCQYESL